MKTKLAAIWCFTACLCGCAHDVSSTQTMLPTTSEAAAPKAGSTLAQRADDLAGRLREKAAQVPINTQNFLDSVGDSDVVRCMMPVLAVGGLVAAIIFGGGGQIGGFNCIVPATSPA